MSKVTFKRLVILFLFFLLGVLIVVSFSIFRDKHDLLRVDAMPMYVYVDTDWGYFPDIFNDTNVLNFSRMVIGQRFGRTINVVNPFDFPVEVVFKADGRIREFLYTDVNEVLLGPNEARSFSFFLQIPAVTYDVSLEKKGDYNGTLYIRYYRV